MLLEKDLTAETLIRDIDEILLDAQTLEAAHEKRESVSR